MRSWHATTLCRLHFCQPLKFFVVFVIGWFASFVLHELPGNGFYFRVQVPNLACGAWNDSVTVDWSPAPQQTAPPTRPVR
jgi:hypothetical protein